MQKICTAQKEYALVQKKKGKLSFILLNGKNVTLHQKKKIHFGWSFKKHPKKSRNPEILPRSVLAKTDCVRPRNLVKRVLSVSAPPWAAALMVDVSSVLTLPTIARAPVALIAS